MYSVIEFSSYSFVNKLLLLLILMKELYSSLKPSLLALSLLWRVNLDKVATRGLRYPIKAVNGFGLVPNNLARPVTIMIEIHFCNHLLNLKLFKIGADAAFT